jgi:hypothetical protein
MMTDYAVAHDTHDNMTERQIYDDRKYNEREACFRDRFRFYHICKDGKKVCCGCYGRYGYIEGDCFFCLGPEYGLAEDEVHDLYRKDYLSFQPVNYKEEVEAYVVSKAPVSE